jgi:hypothetical protein
MPYVSYAENNFRPPQEDSKELQFQDMLMNFLTPQIDKAVADYYTKLLTETPHVYPYQVDVIKVERLNGFRGFDFLITLEVMPVVGPHVSVGKEHITFEIAPTIPNVAKVTKYEHLETYELPPHWQHIIKRT